jgi:hypothetical protein
MNGMTEPTTDPTTNPTTESIPDSVAEKCEHILHSNGLHEVILKEFGMSGADAFLSQIERMYQGRTATDAPLLLIMNSPGSLPISYSLQRGKELMTKYPDVGSLRVAVLSDSLFETHLVDSFMRLMRFPGIKMRFFAAAKRSDAEKWLFEGS